MRERLDDALQRCERAAANGGAADYAMANAHFHEALYAGCHNEVLAEQIRLARRLIQRYRLKDFQNQAQIAKSLEDHRRIARAPVIRLTQGKPCPRKTAHGTAFATASIAAAIEASLTPELLTDGTERALRDSSRSGALAATPPPPA